MNIPLLKVLSGGDLREMLLEVGPTAFDKLCQQA